MPSVQQFANLCCKNCTTVITTITGCNCKMEGDTVEDKVNSGVIVLASALPPLGMQRCGFTDSKHVSFISEKLLETLSIAVVEKGSRDPFGSAIRRAEETRKDLLHFVNTGSNDLASKLMSSHNGDIDNPSAVVGEIFDRYVGSTRNILTQLSTKLVLGDKREEKIKDFKSELTKIGFWPLQRREKVARVLIERVDARNVAHCSQLFPLDDEDALAAHQAECRFAPFQCLNPGCNSINSVLHVTEHDEICPWKLIPCSQECGSSVPRQSMAAHCANECSMRSVLCPFSANGCTEPLLEHQLLKHCQDLVEKHLYLTYLSHQKTAAMVDQQEHRLGLTEQMVATMQSKVDSDAQFMMQSLGKAESKVAKLEVEVKKLNSALAHSASEIKHLKKEMSELRNMFKRESESKDNRQ